MIVNILKEVISISMLTLLRRKHFTFLNSCGRQCLQLFCGKSLSKSYPGNFFCLILQQQQNSVTFPVSPTNVVIDTVTVNTNGQSASLVFEADAQVTYNLENVDMLRLMKKKKAEI